MERAARRPEGTVLRLSGQPITSGSGRFLGFRGTGSDITDEYTREEETARLARYDSLTGLPNLRALRREAAQRPEACGVACLLLDQSDTLEVGYGLGAQ